MGRRAIGFSHQGFHKGVSPKDLDLEAYLTAHRPPGGCTVVFPTTLDIGRPSQMRCMHSQRPQQPLGWAWGGLLGCESAHAPCPAPGDHLGALMASLIRSHNKISGAAARAHTPLARGIPRPDRYSPHTPLPLCLCSQYCAVAPCPPPLPLSLPLFTLHSTTMTCLHMGRSTELHTRTVAGSCAHEQQQGAVHTSGSRELCTWAATERCSRGP